MYEVQQNGMLSASNTSFNTVVLPMTTHHNKYNTGTYTTDPHNNRCVSRLVQIHTDAILGGWMGEGQRCKV